MDNIKILMLEDDADDADIIRTHLQEAGFNFNATVVPTRKDYIKALEESVYDVILCDHYLNEFNSSDAIKIRNEKNLSTPFLLVSGAVSDASAINLINNGANDYVLKDKLHRLPRAIMQAIEKEKIHREKIITEQELIKNNAWLKLLFNSSSEVLFDLDIVTGQVKMSDGYKINFGYDVEENMTSLNDWRAHIHEEDQEAVWNDYQRSVASQDPEWKYTYRILRADNSIAYVISRAITMRHNDGRAYRMLGSLKDITNQKSLEQEREKIIYEVLERNKELEQFSYMVSHNLRSPVSNIMALSEALGDESYPEELRKEFLNQLNNSVSRLDDVIKDLYNALQIRHNTGEIKEVVCFDDIVKDVKTNIKDLIEKYKVLIETDFDEADRFMSVKTYIYSVFFTLISNGIKYRQPDREPVISLKSYKTIDGLRLIISDNGLGVDLKKNRNDIFGLYKRFHHHIEGKGLNLFIAKTQIEKLGGTIDIESEVNRGTTFKIFLPFVNC